MKLIRRVLFVTFFSLSGCSTQRGAPADARRWGYSFNGSATNLSGFNAPDEMPDRTVFGWPVHFVQWRERTDERVDDLIIAFQVMRPPVAVLMRIEIPQGFSAYDLDAISVSTEQGNLRAYLLRMPDEVFEEYHRFPAAAANPFHVLDLDRFDKLTGLGGIPTAVYDSDTYPMEGSVTVRFGGRLVEEVLVELQTRDAVAPYKKYAEHLAGVYRRSGRTSNDKASEELWRGRVDEKKDVSPAAINGKFAGEWFGGGASLP